MERETNFFVDKFPEVDRQRIRWDIMYNQLTMVLHERANILCAVADFWITAKTKEASE